MKILSVKALNINSLKGEVAIDFEALTQDSALFAITGPTGSGKSTILDIISCALYGRTSRLKNPNDLMSRHSGEAYCEVVFEIRGHKYRSSWSQKRARKHHDGKFQTAKMELVDLEDDKPLPLKSKEVPKKVEELSGLDFGRFTQSMLLAQGSFDAFLKADEKERSALLEKITGTQIYAQISSRVYQTFVTLQREMETDKKILESIELLDDETIVQKEKTLGTHQSIKEKTEGALEQLSLSLNWLQRRSELTSDTEKYALAFKDATALKVERKDAFVQLDLANRALHVMGAYDATQQLQTHLGIKTEKVMTLATELETLKEELKRKAQEQRESSKALEKADIHFDQESQKLKKARDLETQEKHVGKMMTKSESLIKEKEKQFSEIKEQVTGLLKKHTDQEAEIQTKRAYLSVNAKDKALLSELGVIAQNIKHYHEQQSTLVTAQKELEAIEVVVATEQKGKVALQEEVVILKERKSEAEDVYTTLAKVSKDDATLERSLSQKFQDTQTLQETLNRYVLLEGKKHEEFKALETNRAKEKLLLQSQTTLSEHVETLKAHLSTLYEKKEQEQQFKNYEEDRKKLVEGEACFLCGSHEHPFVDERPDVSVDETQVVIRSQKDLLEEKEQALKALALERGKLQVRGETLALELERVEEEMLSLLEVFNSYDFELQDESALLLKEQLEAVEQQLVAIKQNRIKKDALLKEREDAREQHQTKEQVLNALILSLQKQESRMEQLQSSVTLSSSKVKEVTKLLSLDFQTFSMTLDVGRLDAQLAVLTQRKEHYAEHVDALKVLEAQLQSTTTQKVQSEAQLKSLSTVIEAEVKSLSAFEEQLRAVTTQRVAILNVVDLESYEQELKAGHQKVQKDEKRASSEMHTLEVKQKEWLLQHKKLEVEIVEDEVKLKGLGAQLDALYKEHGFKDEAELQKASLAIGEREALAQQCQAIEHKLTQTQALLLQTSQQLKEHEKEALTTASETALKTLQALLQQKADALSESIGSIKTELELNQKSEEKHKEQITSLLKREESFKVWIKLNELIGSADGTKFKKFAQGITLDQLINLANQHLKQLSSRYMLVRSEEKLLELEIIDAYQGNVVRPVSTLSGGESFIVSLALALGLSELASQKIAIDSLFLDEGFGTLDEESLETALNALNLLQSGGKMVGVISHVEALKERIPLQIKVVPNGDGTSFVEIN